MIVLVLRAGHDLGDLLRDSSLTGTVIIQVEMVDHLTGVLGGGIHGGAAGGQLTGHALAHGTVDDAGHILRDDRAEYFLAAGLVQDLTAARLGLLLLGGLHSQRQHLDGDCRLGHHGIEPGVADLYRIVLALEVALGDLAGQLEALSHRYIGGQQHFLREQFGFVVGKVLCRALADGQHGDGAFGGVGLLEHIGVIAAGQAAVACNDDQQGAFDLISPQVGIAGPGVCRRDLGQRCVQRFKIGAAVLHPLLGTAHFGGSHQLHGLGDLHGALYAFDAQLDVLHGTSHALRLLPFNAP